jgi:hypothetical protein
LFLQFCQNFIQISFSFCKKWKKPFFAENWQKSLKICDHHIDSMPWRRGARNRRPGFESRQGARFLRTHGNAVMYVQST